VVVRAVVQLAAAIRIYLFAAAACLRYNVAHVFFGGVTCLMAGASLLIEPGRAIYREWWILRRKEWKLADPLRQRIGTESLLRDAQ
jgi:hypothetical protein